MARALISLCLRNPFLVGVLAIAATAWGFWCMQATPVDAIPDIGEKQVIVFADWPGRSPQDVDDQVTYPLTSALEGTPQVKTIRSMSGLGFSMVFVIFEDDADYYWARTRVLERLSTAQGRLPEGVTPELGPDATALGQVFWYTLEGEGFSLEELRGVQDWFVRYQLNAIPGVSEVASIGGHVREYQIDVDPDRMRAHHVSLRDVFEAVRRSNLDVGAKVVEKNGVEFFVRGVGFVKTVEDLENVVIRQEGGTPLYVKNVARVNLGPEFRRGALNKEGYEAVGGIVLARVGANPRTVIQKVKEQIARLEPGLPVKTLADGRVSRMTLVPYYDRSVIIGETMKTLKDALTEELLCAGIVVLVFLMHLRASISILATLPLSMALAFLGMYHFGVDMNIMSAAGLAIAIGDVADMGIIMTESIYRHLSSRRSETLSREGYFKVVEEAAHEVGPAILTAVVNTILSFIPVFFLEDQEGKLFKPLAYTKTFAIAASVVLALTVVPSLALLTLREPNFRRRTRWILAGSSALLAAWGSHLAAGWGWGESASMSGWPMAAAIGIMVFAAVLRMTTEKLRPTEDNAVSRGIERLYIPTLRWVLSHKALFLALPSFLLALGMTIWLGAATLLSPIQPALESARLWSPLVHTFPGLGREFMPPLDEGSFLYMPSLLPSGSLTQALEVIGKQNAGIRNVPEVLDVVGKIGRADSALDPAPIGMVETIITLKPESQWRRVPVERWFSGWPPALKAPLAALLPEERALTKAEILKELEAVTAIPGVLPTWLQPIQTRLVMLSSGFRAMMGVKIFGPDLHEIERIGIEVERILKEVPGAVDVVADRIVGKPYLEYVIDREAAARYGVVIQDIQEVIETAVGGMLATTTVEGTARYPVRVRYARELRDTLESLEKVLLPTATGAQIPLSTVTRISYSLGPQEIKSENTLKVGYVTLNTRDRDEISVVEDADLVLKARIADGSLRLPAGYYYQWGGQFEAQVRATARLKILIPAVLLLMFVSLRVGLGSSWMAATAFVGILVEMMGGLIMLSLWGANLSVAVWVGVIALLGVADDDAVVMLTYLKDTFKGKSPASREEVRSLVVQGSRLRIRACLMTMATTVFGLIPVFTSDGRGSDVMQPMAIPSIGGMLIQLVTIFIAPCIFCAVMERRVGKVRP